MLNYYFNMYRINYSIKMEVTTTFTQENDSYELNLFSSIIKWQFLQTLIFWRLNYFPHNLKQLPTILKLQGILFLLDIVTLDYDFYRAKMYFEYAVLFEFQYSAFFQISRFTDNTKSKYFKEHRELRIKLGPIYGMTLFKLLVNEQCFFAKAILLASFATYLIGVFYRPGLINEENPTEEELATYKKQKKNHGLIMSVSWILASFVFYKTSLFIFGLSMIKKSKLFNLEEISIKFIVLC